MLDSIRESFELLRDQVWFFRFVVIIGIICIYRTLLHYVLRSNHCANPFCTKCLGSGTLRGRAMNQFKEMLSDDEKNSLISIVLNNMIEYDRLCRKSNEKPTVYFHRGLSSNEIKLNDDQQILIDHFDEIRQEIVKFFQTHDNIKWTNLYLYKNGEENKINCQLFPKLFEILNLLPNLICIKYPNCLFGNCFITRSASNENEENENLNGLTNCSIRMHFGLICDDQSSAYVLINKYKHLPIENKRAILYNNAIEHSIKNPDEKKQIFLTIDFWHPDLSSEMRQQLTSGFHTDLA